MDNNMNNNSQDNNTQYNLNLDTMFQPQPPVEESTTPVVAPVEPTVGLETPTQVLTPFGVQESSVEQTIPTEVQPIVEPIVPPIAVPVELPVQPENEENAVKTSGTATEEELVIDATKPNKEVLDEYAINKDLAKEKKKEKHNTLFVVIVLLIIIGFIIALPILKKMIGF